MKRFSMLAACLVLALTLSTALAYGASVPQILETGPLVSYACSANSAKSMNSTIYTEFVNSGVNTAHATVYVYTLANNSGRTLIDSVALSIDGGKAVFHTTPNVNPCTVYDVEVIFSDLSESTQCDVTTFQAITTTDVNLTIGKVPFSTRVTKRQMITPTQAGVSQAQAVMWSCLELGINCP